MNIKTSDSYVSWLMRDLLKRINEGKLLGIDRTPVWNQRKRKKRGKKKTLEKMMNV